MILFPEFRRWSGMAAMLAAVVAMSPARAAITVTNVEQQTDASSYNDDTEGPSPAFDLTDPGSFDHTAASSVSAVVGTAGITSKLTSNIAAKDASLSINATQEGSFSLSNSAGADSYTAVTVSFTSSTSFTYTADASASLAGDDVGEPSVSLVDDQTGESVFEYVAGTPPESGKTSAKLPAGDYTFLAESDLSGSGETGDALSGTFGFHIGFRVVASEPPVLKVNAPASTGKSKILITGTAKSAIKIKRVEYQTAGQGKFRRAKGKETWSFHLRLKAGLNKVTIRATDVDGNSAVQKIQIQHGAVK